MTKTINTNELGDYSSNNPIWKTYQYFCQGDKDAAENIISDLSKKGGKYKLLDAVASLWYGNDDFLSLLQMAKPFLNDAEMAWWCWLQSEYQLTNQSEHSEAAMALIEANRSLWYGMALNLTNSRTLTFLNNLKSYQDLRVYLLENNVDNAWSLIGALRGCFSEVDAENKFFLALSNYYYAHVGSIMMIKASERMAALEKAIKLFHQLGNLHYLGICYLEYANHEQQPQLAIQHLQIASDLFLQINKTILHKQISLKIQGLSTKSLRSKQISDQYLFVSKKMKEVLKDIERIVKSNSHVLILGATGTGKEVVANMIHQLSQVTGQCISVNCASFSKDLISSELFGHEKGAFTGAVALKQGLFEQANGGTLFLDEFADLSDELQTSLLRVLQDGIIRRVGAKADIQVNVRIIAATNRPVEELVRPDLLHRFVWKLTLAPLYERKEEILPLAQHFIALNSNGEHYTLTSQAKRFLLSRTYPGNIRDLQNTIIRGIANANYAKSCLITQAMLRDKKSAPQFPSITDTDGLKIDPNYDRHMNNCERDFLTVHLQRAQGNKVAVSRASGLNRSRLYRLLEKHKISA